MTIAARSGSARVRWSRDGPGLSVGLRLDELAGRIERRGPRFIATDGLGVVIGTFDSERVARASLEPGMLERRRAARALRDRSLVVVAGAAALGSTAIAIAGMLSLLA